MAAPAVDEAPVEGTAPAASEEAGAADTWADTDHHRLRLRWAEWAAAITVPHGGGAAAAAAP